jgi:starch synthase
MTIDENGVDYTDNGERAIFFARGVLETVKKLRWVPDIIHVQGWMGAVVPLYIKTAYHEEPSFANTKVVTSLFSKTLNSNLGENFKKSIEFREAKASSLKKYNDLFDFEELNKLAIDYSDGVIAGCNNVDEKLLKYAADNNIPTLSYPGEDFQDAYEEFYEKI